MADNISALENLEKSFLAIKLLDDKISAWEEVFTESARIRAKQIDADPNPMPLKGLVIGAKDIFDFAGRPPGNGAKVTPLKVPTKDALLIQQLKEAGAVIAGVLKLTELCYFDSGPTRNPHNPEHTPGGSSSGPAAAVAAGMVPVSIGSQSKGSTIRPASFCGVYGFKPSFGVCSMAGAMNLTYSMDYPGIFARDVENLSKVFEVLAEPRLRKPPYNHCLYPTQPSTSHFKIGILNLADHLNLDPEMKNAVEAYAEELKEQGHNIEWVSPPEGYDEVEAIYQGVFIPEVYDALGYIIERGESEKVGPEIRKVIEAGKKAIIRDYFEALHRRDRLAYKLDLLFDTYDFLVLPSALGPAPYGLKSTGDPICTTITSLTGIPAASVPFGATKNNLPLGIQVIARRYNDRALLSALRRMPSKIVKPALFAE